MKKSSKNASKELSVEDIYKKKNHREHILDLPDTYIGSAEPDTREMYVYDDESSKIIKKDITYVPGLYKIYDEILVNARDHSIRDKNCKNIKVSINKDEGTISVWNDGAGIPVELHKEHNVYVPELIFGHLLTSSNYEQKGKIVGGKNGYGSKCISPLAFLPTWNGKIKLAKDIIVGDELIGDDGTKRIVKKIITGKGQMYEVEQANADSYKVNDEHILTLHMPDHKVIFWNSSKNGWSVLWWDNDKKEIKQKCLKVSQPEKIKCEECDLELSGNIQRHYRRVHKDKEIPKKERKSPTKNPEETEEIKKTRQELEEFCKTIPDNNVFDISIKDYIKLNNTTKLRLAGVRGQCVQWEKKEVEIDPYVLGLWLGDGYSTGYAHACYGEKDPEIINYLTEWGKTNDATIKQRGKYTYTIKSTTHEGEKGYSPLRNQLKKYNLVNNKHIPIEYIVNDRDTRLKVLAGIIDTDGYVSRDGTRINIAQGLEHKQIIDDIMLLGRSLGFNCQLTKGKTTWSWKGEKKDGEAYKINISGNGVEDIPTLLPRKKCAAPEIRNTNKSTGYITIKDAGIDDYVGFEIDDNQRFVMNDFTVTHNCTNVFSTEFIVETVDAKQKKKYVQRFLNNLSVIEKPTITDVKDKEVKSYTQITFKPDYARFGIKGLTNDILALFKKRVFDLAATTSEKVKVSLDDKIIKVNNFEDYINMYYSKLPSELIFEENERWKVGVLYDSNSGYQQMSFVNGVCTYQGGNHVINILEQITKQMVNYIKEKKKVVVKASYIRDNINIFVDSVIEDPSFSSQTKEFLTSKTANFGSKIELSENFIKRLADTGLADEVVKFSQFKEMAGLNKTDGKKVSRLMNIEKLADAEWAGTKKAKYTKLILTEGDSAKAFALSGLEIIGREKYGVFPLRGKLLNVREATASQLLNNKEFINLKKILGLKQNKKYTDVSQLRYGGIITLTDQDVDGSHIKGLIINLIHTFWPSLLKVKGFIQSMSTPIIKAFKKSDTKKQNPKVFYTITDYRNWIESEEANKWTIKYYKGLGTSTEKEAKEVFNDFDNRLIKFIWETSNQEQDIEGSISLGGGKLKDKSESSEDSDIEESEDKEDDTESAQDDDGDDLDDINSKSNEAILLAFEKLKANDRKNWLFNYDKNNIIDYTEKEVGYSDFINKDLIHFSNYDNERSIPSLCDGFKPSQRKIMYACLKRKIEHEEIKVAQLGAYVAEQTEYHHGEVSLQGAIINMAQDFVGTNNINLLLPIGNFGYRRLGGDDAASARYIFTKLSPLTSYLFRKEDEAIYDYIVEEGRSIEPTQYAPILPMVLINGTKGIGTGFSTTIPMFNPKEVAQVILDMLNESAPRNLAPWYYGFKGKITKLAEDKYQTTGVYEILNETTIRITEIPIGYTIDKFKEHLESFLVIDKKVTDNSFLTNVVDKGGNNTVNFEVTFVSNKLQQMIKNNSIEKKFKLTTSIALTNMYLHNPKGTITKYEYVQDIFEEFYSYRLSIYKKRKEFMIRFLENQMNLLKYKVLFIEEKLSGKIVIEKRKEEDILNDLAKRGYPKLHTDVDADEEKKSYGYITSMQLFSLTREKIDKLNEEYQNKKKEYEEYKTIKLETLWKREIEEFITQYDKYMKELDEEKANENDSSKKKKGKSSKKK